MSRVTIAICTCNRAEILGYPLEALRRLPDPPESREVLVINNGSTDGTAQYLAGIERTWQGANLRVIDEPTMGLSRARNTALRASESEYVAFIDDDTVVSQDWLGAMTECFSRHPSAAMLGGPIRVRWLDQRPEWMDDSLLSYYSALDCGPEDCRLEYPNYPYGANLCVQREAALEVGGFPIELGYRGRSLIGGEETELARRLCVAGWEIWYSARASVDHLILSRRTSVQWLARRARGGGIAETWLRKRQLSRMAQLCQMMKDMRWWRYAAKQRRRDHMGERERACAEVRFWRAVGLCEGWWARR